MSDYDKDRQVFTNKIGTKKIFSFDNLCQKEKKLKIVVFIDALKTNDNVLSAFRRDRMQNDIAAKLLDEKGNLKLFNHLIDTFIGVYPAGFYIFLRFFKAFFCRFLCFIFPLSVLYPIRMWLFEYFFVHHSEVELLLTKVVTYKSKDTFFELKIGVAKANHNS